MNEDDVAVIPLKVAPGAVALLDGAGKVLSVSPVFADLLGARDADWSGRVLGEVLAPEDRGPWLEAMRSAERVELGVPARRDDGLPLRAVWLLGPPDPEGRRVVQAHPLGPPVRWASEADPVDPLADRAAVDRAISHDLRGALRGVSGFLGLVGRDAAALPPQAREFLETAQRSATIADEIASRLVEWLRIGQRPLAFEPVDLDALVAAAVEEHRSEGEQSSGFELEADALPAVAGENRLLRGLVRELIANAETFGAGSMRVVRRRGEDERWVWIELADDGPGVDAELAEAAFALFRLLQPKGRYPGVGAGLAICRRIAEVHGGRITFDTTADRGATVVLRLLAAP